MSDSLLKKPHDEARARIIWGESPAEVLDWLVREGLTEEQAEVIIRDIKKERTYQIRRSALRTMRIGILMLLGGMVLMFVIQPLHFIPRIVIIPAVGLLLVGLYKLTMGFFRFLCGRSEGSLTEMD